MFLSDQIVIGDPVDAAISIGDIVLAVGIVELAYFGSRRPRRRGHPAATAIDLTAADEIDLARAVSRRRGLVGRPARRRRTPGGRRGSPDRRRARRARLGDVVLPAEVVVGAREPEDLAADGHRVGGEQVARTRQDRSGGGSPRPCRRPRTARSARPHLRSVETEVTEVVQQRGRPQVVELGAPQPHRVADLHRQRGDPGGVPAARETGHLGDHRERDDRLLRGAADRRRGARTRTRPRGAAPRRAATPRGRGSRGRRHRGTRSPSACRRRSSARSGDRPGGMRRVRTKVTASSTTSIDTELAASTVTIQRSFIGRGAAETAVDGESDRTGDQVVGARPDSGPGSGRCGASEREELGTRSPDASRRERAG